MFDFGLALLVLLFLSVPIALIGLLLSAVSGWPPVFSQERVGLRGRSFVLFKLRTMDGVPSRGGGGFEPGSTRRVTPIGRLLRKTKLDELPQLWNVLRGDMSLVGPRPEVRKWVEAYPERWAFVHQVRPGITDPASIEFRNEEELLAGSADPEKTYREEVLPRKLDLYTEYVRTRGFWGDVKILWRTLVVVLRG